MYRFGALCLLVLFTLSNAFATAGDSYEDSQFQELRSNELNELNSYFAEQMLALLFKEGGICRMGKSKKIAEDLPQIVRVIEPRNFSSQKDKEDRTVFAKFFTDAAHKEGIKETSNSLEYSGFAYSSDDWEFHKIACYDFIPDPIKKKLEVGESFTDEEFYEYTYEMAPLKELKAELYRETNGSPGMMGCLKDQFEESLVPECVLAGYQGFINNVTHVGELVYKTGGMGWEAAAGAKNWAQSGFQVNFGALKDGFLEKGETLFHLVSKGIFKNETTANSTPADPAEYFLAVMHHIFAITTGAFGCQKWAGIPFQSDCLIPWRGWDKSSCSQKINIVCGTLAYLVPGEAAALASFRGLFLAVKNGGSFIVRIPIGTAKRIGSTFGMSSQAANTAKKTGLIKRVANASSQKVESAKQAVRAHMVSRPADPNWIGATRAFVLMTSSPLTFSVSRAWNKFKAIMGFSWDVWKGTNEARMTVVRVRNEFMARQQRLVNYTQDRLTALEAANHLPGVSPTDVLRNQAEATRLADLLVVYQARLRKAIDIADKARWAIFKRLDRRTQVKNLLIAAEVMGAKLRRPGATVDEIVDETWALLHQNFRSGRAWTLQAESRSGFAQYVEAAMAEFGGSNGLLARTSGPARQLIENRQDQLRIVEALAELHTRNGISRFQPRIRLTNPHAAPGSPEFGVVVDIANTAPENLSAYWVGQQRSAVENILPYINRSRDFGPNSSVIYPALEPALLDGRTAAEIDRMISYNVLDRGTELLEGFEVLPRLDLAARSAAFEHTQWFTRIFRGTSAATAELSFKWLDEQLEKQQLREEIQRQIFEGRGGPSGK